MPGHYTSCADLSASKPIQPYQALYRHATASVGPRACRLSGQGSEHARLLRLILLSYTSWSGKGSQPWPSNATLAARSGLTERQVERGLAALVEAGLVQSKIARRQGARKEIGRVLDLGLHAPVVAHAPHAGDLAFLWDIAREHRDRPAALVTAMLGAYMLACDRAGKRIDDWAEIGCLSSELRRFVGQADNISWYRRVRELEALGLLRIEGTRIFVSPPRAWFGLLVKIKTKPAVAVDEPHAIADLIPIRPRTLAPASTLDEAPRFVRISAVDLDEWIDHWTGTGPP